MTGETYTRNSYALQQGNSASPDTHRENGVVIYPDAYRIAIGRRTLIEGGIFADCLAHIAEHGLGTLSSEAPGRIPADMWAKHKGWAIQAVAETRGVVWDFERDLPLSEGGAK